MAKRPVCCIEIVRDKPSTYRGIGFLVSDDGRVTARERFTRLTKNERRWLETSFDWWIDWVINKKRFHGWDRSEFGGKYTNCFVFKLDEHRFYGFLCHPKSGSPKPEDNKYYFCVLVTYAAKHEWNTEERFLRDCEAMHLDVSVQLAARMVFRSVRKKE
jgi:hypothetical protein